MGLHFRRRLRRGRALTNFSNNGVLEAGLSYRTNLPAWSSPRIIGTGPIIGLLIIVGVIVLLAALGSQ
jgi:hypothetical protein